jgi:hypothetical protein
MATNKPFGFLYIKVNAKAKENMFYDTLQQRLIPRQEAEDQIQNIFTNLYIMTEPKLSDPIVFKYDESHVKLLANRLVLTSSKRALSWRQAAINENTDSVFSYKLDTTDLRASDQLLITLNKPGLYDIKASVAAQPAGQDADCGMTISVGFPGQALFELAYSESQVGKFSNGQLWHTLSSLTLPDWDKTRSYSQKCNGRH